MAEGLEIQIGANVSNAVQGLNQVQTELGQTAEGSVKVAGAVNQATTSINKLPVSTKEATSAVSNLSRIVQDAPFGFIAISNNLQPLFDDFQKLKSQTGSVGGAFKGLVNAIAPPAGISLAFATATSLITYFSKELFNSGQASQKAKSDADKLKESITGIYSETAREAASVSGFIAILKNETETRQRKLSAIKELQQIQPQIFSGLKLEGEAVIGLDNAYKNYLDNLKNVIAVKIKQAQLEQLVEKQLKLQGVTLTANEKKLVEGTKNFQQALSNDPRLQGTDAEKIKQYYKNQENQSKQTLNALESDINQLQGEITELSKGVETVNIKPPKIKAGKLNLNQFLEQEEVEIPLKFPGDYTEISKDVSPVGALIKKSMNEYFKRTEPLDATLLLALDAEKLKKFEFMGFKGLTEAQKDLADTGNMIANMLTPSLDAMIQAVSRGENAFEAFGQGVKAVLVQVIQKLAATAVLAGILSAIFPGGLGGAQGFSAIFGRLAGFRATGGPVSGGSPYVVGERGPELFVPSVSGSIVPNNAVGSFMSGRSNSGGSGMSVLRGQDILLAYARTQRSQLRVNG